MTWITSITIHQSLQPHLGIMADSVSSTLPRLESRVLTIKESSVLNDTINLLKIHKFDRIRCLALGSPSAEFQALYQLAFLKLLAEHFEIRSVSCYDPAFSSQDIELLKELKYDVIEGEVTDPEIVSETLYYMPHAPRSVTEKFINDVKPALVLGNDLTVTAGSLTKAKFLEQLPTLATISHWAENRGVQKPKDGFTEVRRRKRKGSKLVFKEPELEYPEDKLYFRDVKITRIESPLNLPWKDSFSDMALNVFIKKEESEEAGSVDRPAEIAELECFDNPEQKEN